MKRCPVCNEKLVSDVLPVWKFVLLSAVTFGIYQFYWFYKCWAFVKAERKLTFSAFWRAWLAPLYAGVYANQLKIMLALKGIKGGFNPFAVGAAYLFLSAAWWLPSPWQVIGFLNFFPLIPLVKALNEYHQLDEKIPPNNSFAWWQWIFIFLGACLTLLTVVANFL